DPLKEIRERKMKAELAELDIDLEAAGADGASGAGGAGGVPGSIGVQAGRKMIEKCAPAIAAILAYYEQMKGQANTDANIDHGRLIPVFKAVVASVKDGSWPKVKYETEINRRLLASLTPEQEAIWRQECVLPAKGAPPPLQINQA